MFPFKKSFGFTLIEVLLYFGLFVLIVGIAYPVFTEILKSYISLRDKIDLRTEMRNIFLRIQQEIVKSKSIDILTDWEVVFNQKNEKKVIFLGKPIYLDTASSVMSVKGYANNLSIGSISFFGPTYGVNFFASSSCQISSGTSVPAVYAFSGYAWSPNIGWLKFRNDPGEPVYGVCLDNNNELRGFVWNDVVGWISFNCSDLNLCSTSVFYSVRLKNNYLTGSAWNEVIGWIMFFGYGGGIYLAKMNPGVYSFDLISDWRVFVEDLSFSKVDETFKVNIKIKNPRGAYETGETAIVLPFK